jgi:hypothetical protein
MSRLSLPDIHYDEIFHSEYTDISFIRCIDEVGCILSEATSSVRQHDMKNLFACMAARRRSKQKRSYDLFVYDDCILLLLYTTVIENLMA